MLKHQPAGDFVSSITSVGNADRWLAKAESPEAAQGAFFMLYAQTIVDSLSLVEPMSESAELEPGRGQ
jgi:hypothetical protein